MLILIKTDMTLLPQTKIILYNNKDLAGSIWKITVLRMFSKCIALVNINRHVLLMQKSKRVIQFICNRIREGYIIHTNPTMH